MNNVIKITNGTGEGLTELSAFDQALQNAGVSNYNLIPLSSVIPEGFVPQVEQAQRSSISNNSNNAEFGHKLYVVMAQDRASEVGKEAWAGIGWVMKLDEKGGGLFVEHHAGSKEEVIKLLTDSLNSMKSHRSEKYGEIKYEIAGIKCTDKPVCALVVAVYQSEGWK